MIRTRFGRIVAAAVLVASTAAVGLFVEPAGAANTNVLADCTVAGSPQAINNNDTITFTLGTGCGAVMIQSGFGVAGTANVTAPFTMSLLLGTPVGGIAGGTVVFTAPASGSGNMNVYFMATAQSPPQITYAISYPAPTPRSDSLVDNGNGSMTWTYDPVTNGQSSAWVSLYPSGTTCPPGAAPTGRIAVIAAAPSSASVAVSSPATIAAGTMAMLGTAAPPPPGPIVAGSYQACAYYSATQQPSTLMASLAITLSELTPTTTTAAAGDPVTPVFAG